MGRGIATKGTLKKINSEIVDAPDLVIAKSTWLYFWNIFSSKLNKSFIIPASIYFSFNSFVLDSSVICWIIEISKSFEVDAQIVGRVEAAKSNKLTLKSEFGTFEY